MRIIQKQILFIGLIIDNILIQHTYYIFIVNNIKHVLLNFTLENFWLIIFQQH